jgi:2-dehydropantoate 2-reductase
MRVAMMGSGGIGGYVGARLAQAGEDVAFIARGAHLEAMREHGLRVKSPFGDFYLREVTASDTPADLDPVNIVIFAVKLYDTEKAAKDILPLVGPDTRVVTLQNGIDSIDTISSFVPRAQVIGGCTYISADLERAGELVHRGHTQIVIGGAGDETIELFRARCDRAIGVDVGIVEDVDSALWGKFIAVSAFSGGTSLMRAGSGAILDDPEGHIFMEQLRDEGMAVALAAGHPMADGFKDRVMAVWTNLPPDTRSSMANDLLRGKPIELEWLSGRMHALGRQLGVPTPGHTAVYRALHLHACGSSNDRRERSTRGEAPA